MLKSKIIRKAALFNLQILSQHGYFFSSTNHLILYCTNHYGAPYGGMIWVTGRERMKLTNAPRTGQLRPGQVKRHYVASACGWSTTRHVSTPTAGRTSAAKLKETHLCMARGVMTVGMGYRPATRGTDNLKQRRELTPRSQSDRRNGTHWTRASKMAALLNGNASN